MPNRHIVVLCCSLLLPAFRATAQNVDLTGTWNGEFVITDRCTNGSTFTSRGPAAVQFLQSGSAVQGAVTLSNLTDTDGDTCTPRETFTPTLPVSGNVSGGTLNGTLIPPEGGPINFSAVVSATSMTISFAQTVTSGSITLTRTSSQPPGSALSGTYNGTYTATFLPCHKLAPVTYSGGLSVNLLQVGNALTGNFRASGTKSDKEDSAGNCTVIDTGTIDGVLTAVVNGTFITGVVTESDGAQTSFAATVSGQTIAGAATDQDPGEAFSFTITRTSSGTPPPSIISFSAAPATITAGGSATLSWSTVNAATVTIDNGVGSQAIAGSVSVSPRKSTTYTLTASGIGGTASATTTVTVTGTGPRVVAASFPSGMLQVAEGAGATDSFSLANVGTDPANVTLTANGNFFSIAPTSSTLQPGASQSVTINAIAQPAGTYEGTITVSGDASLVVPVRLLVAAAPTGTVNPRPTVARVEITVPAGSVSFTNSGSSAMQGIAVADVPWIIPQSGTITINPGETKSVSFSIDRSKRPDSAALIGSATGALSLRFFGSPIGSTRISDATTPTSTITVTIVDVVKPGVTPGAPPALGSNELALFVAGHGSAPGIAGDLLLSNRGSSPIPDLKLFLTAASQIATLPQLASNIGVTLPSVSTSVFGVEASPSLMLRGTLSNLSAAALRMANPSGASAYFSAIPVFRSDRGVAAGGRLVLSGVERSTNTRTVVVVQELSGTSGTADVQAYDANGAPIGAKASLTMTPFVSTTDGGNTVVEGARSVVITNTGSTRINAYARVLDDNSSDAWIVIDPSATSGASDSLIAPTISASGSSQTDVYVTNATSSSVSAALNVVTSSTRRRSVRAQSLDAGTSATQQLTIRPLETQRTTVSPVNGYVRLSGSPGSISASARLTVTWGGKSFGSALPVVPVSNALASGQSRRFSGVGDASAKTIAAGTAATFRTSLMLIETASQAATVRVSLWYTFPAGTLVSAQTVSSKEFNLNANQMLVINDLARTIIGPQRDSFGDLRDIQVDVEVISGSGSVLPFLESIDNGSGDVVMRSE
ncbi:MAG TPA: hypothetical protein VGS96_15570 [Thermoanaerobaculia bacterium]|jgi:hypothetical protein|nr:hypothetical protein [Thermoanaerobaculia bacterium]